MANEPTREAATGTTTAEERQLRTAVERTRRNIGRRGADELANAGSSAGPSQLARQSTRAVDTGDEGRRGGEEEKRALSLARSPDYARSPDDGNYTRQSHPG